MAYSIGFLFIVCFILFAGAYSIRAGNILVLPGEIDAQHRHTQQRRLIYCFIVGICTLNPFTAIAAYIPILTGWGFPISAATGKNAKADWQKEFALFDKPSLLFTKLITGNNYQSKVYGVVWLAFHGLVTALLFALSFWLMEVLRLGLFSAAYSLNFSNVASIAYAGLFWINPFVVSLGAMGFCYGLTQDWERGDALYGGLIGLVIANQITFPFLLLCNTLSHIAFQ